MATAVLLALAAGAGPSPVLAVTGDGQTSQFDAADAAAVEHLREAFGYSEQGAIRFLTEQPEQLFAYAELLQEHGPHLGGAYFDHHRDGVLVVRVAGPEGVRAQIHAFLEDRLRHQWASLRGRIELQPGRAPLDVLLAAMEDIGQQLRDLTDDDWHMDADTERERINILVVSESTKGRILDFVDLLDLPRDVVHVETGSQLPRLQNQSCTRRNCDPPFRGGLRLIGPLGNCTSGFMATNPSGLYYTLTAGHCGSGSYRHSTPAYGLRTVGGAPLSGTYTQEGVDGGGNPVQQHSLIDAARVYISDTGFWRLGRNVFLDAAANYYAVAHAWGCPTDLPQGLTVRASSSQSNQLHVGTVRTATAGFSLGGVFYQNQLLLTYTGTVDGDSGSPVLVRQSNNHRVPDATGVGIHKGLYTDPQGVTSAIASHVRYVENILEVRLRDATRVCNR